MHKLKYINMHPEDATNMIMKLLDILMRLSYDILFICVCLFKIVDLLEVKDFILFLFAFLKADNKCFNNE